MRGALWLAAVLVLGLGAQGAAEPPGAAAETSCALPAGGTGGVCVFLCEGAVQVSGAGLLVVTVVASCFPFGGAGCSGLLLCAGAGFGLGLGICQASASLLLLQASCVSG